MGKTKQASVRFDPVKLELVKRREKLETAQKVVDFLMDAYYWQNKLTVAPQLSAMGQTLPYVAQDKPRNAVEAYEQKINEAMSAVEIEQIGKLLEVDMFVKKEEKASLLTKATQKVQSFETQ